MLSAIVWDIDPIIIHFGDGGIRWYGLLWAIGIYIAYRIQVKLYKNENVNSLKTRIWFLLYFH